LFEFGYRDVGGVSQYIRGRYIAPYLNDLGKNQSYCIDEQSALQEYISNPLFRRIIDRGNYEYINGHYCLRDSKYIGINSKGEKFLTIYAREHMAECCLVFECRHEKMSVSLSGGAIRKTGVSSNKLVYTDKNGKSLVTEEGLATRKKVLQMMEERAIAEKSFNQMTVDLMTAKGITVEGLADKTGLSEQTIKNMRNDPNKNIGIEAVLAVSIAMNLTPETRELYIDKSPNKWRNTEDMSICRFLMGSCGSMSVADFNRKLLECGSTPLTPLIAGFNEDVFLRPRTEMIS
jgi:DNA-binding Xre family transcriptional regulator